MESIYYVGLDVHKKTIAYCIKEADGRIVRKGAVGATREELRQWAGSIDRPWVGALEATMFTGWIYDFLKPCAHDLKVGHPEMLKAITASKNKNDQLDAQKLSDLLRCNLLPECHMASSQIRELRRVLRYRNLMVRESVRMKNKISGLLMEVGAEYDQKRLHTGKYFEDMLQNIQDVPESVLELLTLSRANMELFQKAQKKLLKALVDHEWIRTRVQLLMSIPGVGEVTALTWVLEIGDPHRFKKAGHAISYCGLCSAQQESAGKSKRGPISKKRNKYLQCILIEAAHLAPRWNPELSEVYARETNEGGNKNQATLAVARKLTIYLLAVDKRKSAFIPR